MRRRLGSLVPRAALTEEPRLFLTHRVLAPRAAQACAQTRVALAGKFGDLPTSHSVQYAHRRAEALGDARGIEIGEIAHAIEAQTLPSGGEFLVPERRQGLLASELRTRASGNHHPLTRGQLSAEQAFAHPEGYVEIEHVAHEGAHRGKDRLVPAEEATRPAQGQDA